ncbi:MAG: ABC transporter permease subunit [Clostridium sp.]
MNRLLKAELYKLFKNKTFRVLCVISIVLSLLMAALASPLMGEVMMDALGDMPEDQKEMVLSQMGIGAEQQVVTPGSIGFHLSAKDPMNPTTLEVYHASFGAGALEILIGVLIAAFMAKEYTQGTIKNTLAYGKKRWEFYLSKFLAIVIGTAIFTLSLVTISTIASLIMNGVGNDFGTTEIMGMLLTFVAALIANAATISIIMIIGTLVKSNGATIGISVGIFVILPTLISFLYGIYPWFDKIYELTPFYNILLATSVLATTGDVVRSMIIAGITTVIGLVVGIQMFKKQDIK